MSVTMVTATVDAVTMVTVTSVTVNMVTVNFDILKTTFSNSDLNRDKP